MFFEKFAQGGSIMRQEGSELKEQKKFNEKMSSLLEKVWISMSYKFSVKPCAGIPELIQSGELKVIPIPRSTRK